MFQFGILSVLYALNYFESIEEYEECQHIINAIKYQEKRLDCKLYTKDTKECIKEIIATYKKHNLTGVYLIENSKYYADYIVNQELKA